MAMVGGYQKKMKKHNMKFAKRIEDELGRNIKLNTAEGIIEGELRGCESPNDNDEHEYGLFIEDTKGEMYIFYESEILDFQFVD